MGKKNRSKKASKAGASAKPDLDVGQLADVLATSGEAVTSTGSSANVVDYGYDGARLNVQLMQGEPHFAAAEKLVEADRGRTMAKYSQPVLQAFEDDLKGFVTSHQNAAIERSESARKLSVLAASRKGVVGGKARQLMKGTKSTAAALLMAKKGKPVVINKGTARGPMAATKGSTIRRSIQKRH
ncbi:hypothetical protein FOZ62_023394 [Perkinsus olseni]|uniref:Uncharacterized protein n=1 Tax=Perkinsus olseni TaxID=32597 RepID=A0A7J6TKJ2_PEROL|nr:hypothetical protein FOZ62_023394 [Perkinsus olseni]